LIYSISSPYLQAAWEIEDKKPSESWPDKGCVQFDNYGLRYREGLDLVIKGISCKIEPTEKVSAHLYNKEFDLRVTNVFSPRIIIFKSMTD